MFTEPKEPICVKGKLKISPRNYSIYFIPRNIYPNYLIPRNVNLPNLIPGRVNTWNIIMVYVSGKNKAEM